MKRELRVFTLDTIEQRGIDDNAGKREFVGHASVFDSLSEELWGFYERVAPTAFDDAINGVDDVRLLFNHDPNRILARTKSETLKLSKDDTGLVSSATFPDTSYARDIAESMDRGDVDGMSFGFRTIEDSWEEEDHEIDGVGTVTILVRTLVKVELFDVSIVVYPAYPETDAELNQAPAYRYLGVAPFIPTPPEKRAEPAEEPEPAATPTTHSFTINSTAAAEGNSVSVSISVDTEELERQLTDAEELVTDFAERVGKVLSSKNKEALSQAKDLLDGVIASAAEAEAEEAEEENAQPAAEENAAAIVRAQRRDGEGILELPHEERELVFTAEEIDPHGVVCGECEREFSAGDEYAHRQVEENVFEIICTDCSALEAVELEPERSGGFDLERRRLDLIEKL